MADRVNVTMRVEATDSATGEKYWAAAEDWPGVAYADFVQFQGLLLKMQADMLAWGQEKAKGKAHK